MRTTGMEGQWGGRGKELGARSREDAGLYPMQEKGIMSERDWMRTKQVNQRRLEQNSPVEACWDYDEWKEVLLKARSSWR